MLIQGEDFVIKRSTNGALKKVRMIRHSLYLYLDEVQSNQQLKIKRKMFIITKYENVEIYSLNLAKRKRTEIIPIHKVKCRVYNCISLFSYAIKRHKP